MKKLVKITRIAVVSLVALAMLAFGGFAAYILSGEQMTEEEAKAYILKEIEPWLQEVREEYDIPDLEIKLFFTSFESTPASFSLKEYRFNQAKVEANYFAYYYSSTFTELDETDQLNLFTYKYDSIPDLSGLGFHGVGDIRNIFSLRWDYDACGSKNRYLTEAGNVYEFGNYDAYRNGEVVCEIRPFIISGSGSGSSSAEKCTRCNGTGSVKYYYGDSDLQAYLEGHDPYTFGPCSSCDGTGYDD